MSEIKLLPCPFCGGEVRIKEVGKKTVCRFQIICKCGKAMTPTFQTEKEVAQVWNTRKPMERIIERLEDARAECKELQRTTTDAYGYMKMKQGIDCAKDIVKEEGGIE